MDHDDAEAYQTAGIGNTASGNLPDDFQHWITIGITQKHEVLVKLRINEKYYRSQNYYLQD